MVVRMKAEQKQVRADVLGHFDPRTYPGDREG
jgi:hypothetical protein